MSVRLGAGAGFSGDRVDPARELAVRGNLDYLIFECLGERTIAASNARKLRDATAGYDPLLEVRMRAVLGYTSANRTTVITNSGAANPVGAAEAVARVAKEVAKRPVRIAAITGDDVLDAVRTLDPQVWETGRPLSEHAEDLVSANAYIGADAILEGLDAGADVVIAGRAADPSMFVAPLIHEFGADWLDPSMLGKATAVGHLLECAGQLTGGYYADPVTKPVPGMARLGFPFADVGIDGSVVFGKLSGTGGELTTRTCAEQLLYEVGDPEAYLTPDVTADFSAIAFETEGPNLVRMSGATGRPRPEQLKVTLGFKDGWLGEGQISYAGLRAFERADLAGQIVSERLEEIHGIPAQNIFVELIGAGAAFRGSSTNRSPHEVRLRVTVRGTKDAANLAGWEVESLYTNGPAGGGGARRSITEVLAIRSCLIPRGALSTEVHLMEARP